MAALDLGFGGFLEKFEEHFGRGWTKALLTLIGLAIASVCIGIVWQYLVAPVLTFFQAPGHLESLARITLAGASIASGATIALRIYDWHQGRKLNPRATSREDLKARVKATEELLDALEAKRREELRSRRQKRD
jgi:hypothetical protein